MYALVLCVFLLLPSIRYSYSMPLLKHTCRMNLLCFSSTCYYYHISDQNDINAIGNDVLHFSWKSTSKQHPSDPFHPHITFSFFFFLFFSSTVGERNRERCQLRSVSPSIPFLVDHYLTMLPNGSASASIDTLSRILIIIASFFAVAALALCIVGIATNSWYYNEDTSGNTLNYNLFTICTGNTKNGSSSCLDMPRSTLLGAATLNAAALLVVAICLLGCGMIVIVAMNFVRFTGALVLIGPLVLFLACLFILAAFAEVSRMSTLNSYSAILVQTGHISAIFTLGIIAFASGRLHVRYYDRF